MLLLKPVRFAVNVTALVPDPTDCNDVVSYVDSVLFIPHSKQAVVERPFGLTVPFRVAPAVPTFVAVFDITVGAEPAVPVCAFAA